MQTTTEREVIAVTPAEHEKIQKALSLYGSVTRMMKGAELSRQAVINLRDKGRAEKTTVEKVRKYLAAKNSSKGAQAKRVAA